MSKYMLKERIEKIIEMVDRAQNDIQGESNENLMNSYSIIARATCFEVEQIC